MAHHAESEINNPSSIWASRPGYKPSLLLIAAFVFIGLIVIPPHQSMIDLVSKENPPGYSLYSGCKTITDNINSKLRSAAFHNKNRSNSLNTNGHENEPLFTHRDTAQMAKVMLAIFFLAASMASG